MKISIIIPVYNMASSLAKCVNSILNQKGCDFEIILVDDGSEDDSFEICRGFAKVFNNVIAVHQENQGSGPARNYGIDKATGDYFLFIDSDDELKKDTLKILAQYVAQTEADVYVFGYEIVDTTGKVVTKKYDSRKVKGMIIRENYSEYFSQVFKWGIQGAPWNKLFKGDVIRKNKIEYPPMRRHQDEVFISRVINVVQDIEFVEDVLYTHFSNSVDNVWKKYPITYLSIVNELYQYRKSIIQKWNENDINIKSLIYSEYINNVMRACFRAFEANGLKGYKTRCEWYKKNILDCVEIKRIKYPVELLGKCKVIQNMLFVLAIKKRNLMLLDMIISLKIKTVR